MIETGKVVKVKGKTATVEFERKTACDKCGMCAFKKDEMFVKCTLNNSLDARVGDYVTVHMGKNYVLVAAVIAYMIPLILAGIALACTFMLEEYIQVIVITLALVVGFATAALLDKYVIRKKSGFRPTMVGFAKGYGEVDDSESEVTAFIIERGSTDTDENDELEDSDISVN